MKNKELNINSSYLELCRADSFEDRHIGPSGSEINEMLDELGVKDLETLISSTVPNQILLDLPLELDEPLGELEAIEFLDSKVSQNELFKTYIGMGYY